MAFGDRAPLPRRHEGELRGIDRGRSPRRRPAARRSDLPRRPAPSPGGWTIIAVHESKESWEQFRDDILLPRMQAGIEGGFPTPPEETEIDLYKVMP